MRIYQTIRPDGSTDLRVRVTRRGEAPVKPRRKVAPGDLERTIAEMVRECRREQALGPS